VDRERSELSGFAARLRSVRRAYAEAVDRPDMTPAEFACRLEVPAMAYVSYEQGRKNPPLAALAALHRCTGVSLDWLVADADPESGHPWPGGLRRGGDDGE
jgi:transcriptional regulator with XRE-family HTH domain